jgi:hypothetical protein
MTRRSKSEATVEPDAPSVEAPEPKETIDHALDELERENVELRKSFDAKKEEAEKRAKAERLARENVLLRSQMATAEFPDGSSIQGGVDFLRPDPSRLPAEWMDPNRYYYWARPEQEGFMVQRGYVKETAPEVKQPDGTLARHPRVIANYQLWSTPLELRNRNLDRERELAATREKKSEDLKQGALKQARTITLEDLERRRD